VPDPVIAGIGPIVKPLRMPQERFSRGGRLLRYPPFFGMRIVPEVITLLKRFVRSKTMWTLPPLWTHRTRPQGFGNLAQNARFPQRPHRSSFSLTKRKNEEQKPLRSTVHRIGSPPYAGGSCYVTVSLGERDKGYCYKLVAAVIRPG
jgi:hypothetical protein